MFFYYSGHAKASGLNLGADELALTDLRARLLALPTTLTVVVLDACQSGSFSRIKGAEAAADFSFNSRSRLDASGLAVMASSSASELSQESDILHSSYFTHHLLVGMRGAADTNHDGEVSLDEAYRYAYNQTLLATSATAVGGQHVSLEVDLKGHGEIALSYPKAANAQLALPNKLVGEILVEQTAAQTVVAEVHKVAGERIRIAVAPGAYRVLVRHDGVVDRCPITVNAGGESEVSLEGCDRVTETKATAKGGEFPFMYTVELSAGLGSLGSTGFTQRLSDFGYNNDGTLAPRYTAAFFRRIEVAPVLDIGAQLSYEGSNNWSRGITGNNLPPLRYHWGIASLDLATRVNFNRIFRFRVPRFNAYLQGDLGVAMAHDSLTDETNTSHTTTQFGLMTSATVGVSLDKVFHTPIGVALNFTWTTSTALSNLTGDTYDAKNLFVGVGLFSRF